MPSYGRGCGLHSQGRCRKHRGFRPHSPAIPDATAECRQDAIVLCAAHRVQHNGPAALSRLRAAADRVSLPTEPRSRHGLGLHHRRRRQRRVRSGQPAERTGPQGAFARSRGARHLPLDPYSDGISLLHRKPAHGLVFSHGAGAGAERAVAALSARQGSGRVQFDQRDAVSARSGCRLRRLAADGQYRLGLGRCAALFQTLGGLRRWRVRDARRGGEWRVDNQRLHWQVLDDWKAAAVATGLPETNDFNTGDNEGVGYFKVNQRKGWRLNTARAFLGARSGANLRVETQAQTRKLILEAGRAVGVEYHQGGTLRTARARGEVILCAGAIGSPHILQLSGIGPGDLLHEHGIEVQLEAPMVGRNLQDHLQLRCAWRLTGARTLNTLANSLWGKAAIGLEYLLKRSGPMAMAPSQLGAFARSRPELATADLEYHVQPLSLDAFGEPLHDFPGLTASVCNLRPESRGEVRIASSDPMEAPVIAPNYLSTEGDRQVAAASIRLTRRIMEQDAMKRYDPQEIRPGTAMQTEEELARAAGDIGTTIFHPVGTVHMGPEGHAPLDDRLRLRGIGGLRVVDASVMPTITSGNTNSPTIMIAEKAADMILEDGRKDRG